MSYESSEVGSGGHASSEGGLPVTLTTLLKDELARELERKTSVEKRGITVITASGALVTLVFAITANIVKTSTTNNFTPWETVFLIISVGLFVASAWFGIVTNRPEIYAGFDLVKVGDLLREIDVAGKTRSIDDVSKVDSYIDMFRGVVTQARTVNDYKAGVLQNAIRLQLGAVASLAVSAILISIAAAVT